MDTFSLQELALDQQRPHAQDEVYYVIRGRGRIMVGAEERDVEAGAIVYVAAGVEHRFHSIVEELSVLFFFAPAEEARADSQQEQQHDHRV